MNKWRFAVVFLLCPPLLGLFTGCSDSTKARVRGKVTISGKRFYGTLYAFNQEANRGDSCVIQKAGTYDMSNIPAGKVKFYVTPTGVPGLKQEIYEMYIKHGVPEGISKMSDEEFNKTGFGTNLPPWAKASDFPIFFESLDVASECKSPEKSPLEKTLAGGSSTVFDIDLPSISGGKKKPPQEK